MKDIYCYIVAPPEITTGGPEYCQQICSALNKVPGVKARIAYFTDSETKAINVHPQLYKERYNNPYIINPSIHEDDIYFFPEVFISPAMSSRFDKVKMKFLVWMSVNFYLKSVQPELLNLFPQDFYHLCPSAYSRDYLINFAKISENKIFHIGDPPCPPFFQAVQPSYEKKNEISIQLNKNFFVNNILSELSKRERKDIKVNIINNLTTEEVIDCLKRSKVLVHLSYNPGLERVQQEAILLDNCIIQSTLGCSKYYEDVPIPEEYKFEITEKDVIQRVVDKIEECVDEYEEKIGDFKEFKGVVYKRREELSRDIEKIVEFMREKVNESEKSQSSEETTTVS